MYTDAQIQEWLLERDGSTRDITFKPTSRDRVLVAAACQWRSAVGGLEVPKVVCPCGFVHDLSPIPDDGWLTIRDRDHNALLPPEPAQQPDGSEVVWRMLEMSGRLYECPRCGRLMWTRPGDRCTNFRVYYAEE